MRLPLLFVSCVLVVGCGSITYDDGTQHGEQAIAARGYGCRHHRMRGRYVYAQPRAVYAPQYAPPQYAPPQYAPPQYAPAPLYPGGTEQRVPPPAAYAPPPVYAQPQPPARVMVLPPPATAPMPPPAAAPPPMAYGRPMPGPWGQGAPLVCGGNQRIRIADQRIIGRGGPAVIASGNCVVQISGSIVMGRPAVQASGNAQVQLIESRIRGDLLSGGNAHIDMRGSRHRGRVFETASTGGVLF
jgi:hypothetical protein